MLTDGHNGKVAGFRWGQVGLIALLLGLSSAGCGRAFQAETPARAEWSLSVTNRHWLDVSVHVVYSGQRVRVGTVAAASTESYVLPPFMLSPSGTIQLEANAIGSPGHVTTEALTVRGGQHVAWTLENGLERSSVAVR